MFFLFLSFFPNPNFAQKLKRNSLYGQVRTPLAIHIAFLSAIDYTILREKAMVRILRLIQSMQLT